MIGAIPRLAIFICLPPESLPGEDEHPVEDDQKGHDDEEHVPEPQHDVQLLIDDVEREYACGATPRVLASRRMLVEIAHRHFGKDQVQRRGEVVSVATMHSTVEVIAASREDFT